MIWTFDDFGQFLVGFCRVGRFNLTGLIVKTGKSLKKYFTRGFYGFTIKPDKPDKLNGGD